MTIEIWMSYLVVCAFFVLIPGPSAIYLMTSTLCFGRRTAIATVPGLTFGVLLAMFASLAAINYFAVLFQSIVVGVKLFGAVVLTWFAFKTWHAEPIVGDQRTAAATNKFIKLFQASFIIGAINPKWLIFYLTVIPDFLPGQSSTIQDNLIVIATFLSIAVLASGIWILAATRLQPVISTASRMALVNRFSAILMFALGLFVAVDLVA